jgi:hypothetical protein
VRLSARLNSNALLHEGIESDRPRGSLGREADPKDNKLCEFSPGPCRIAGKKSGDHQKENRLRPVNRPKRCQAIRLCTTDMFLCLRPALVPHHSALADVYRDPQIHSEINRRHAALDRHPAAARPASNLNQGKGLNRGLIDRAGDEQAVVALIICECGARG